MASSGSDESIVEMLALHRRGEPTGFAPAMTDILARADHAARAGNQEEADAGYREMASLKAQAALHVQQAVDADERGDEAAAIKAWSEVATLDDGWLGAKACARLGQKLLGGEHADAGVLYLEGGARGGDAEACFHLGRAYREGTCVRQDDADAVKYFQLAAAAGDLDAHYYLGAARFMGEGTPPDPAEAVRHWKLAATSGTLIEPGHFFRSHAEAALGRAYETGTGVSHDVGEARHWYLKAQADSPPKRRAYFDEILARLSGEPPRAKFPVISVGVFAVSVVASAVAWLTRPELGGPILVLLGADGAWTAFILASVQGARSRAAVRAQFVAALPNSGQVVRIGGVRWVAVDGDFRHLRHDAGEQGLLYKSETQYVFRKRAELVFARERKRDFLAFLVVATIAALVFVGDYHPVLSGIAVAAAGLGALTQLLGEYGYRYGLQMFKGAMVLDPRPPTATLEEVEGQKAHGDARLASEDEALSAASGNVRRSSAHDQIF